MDTTRKKKALRILCIGIILCIISSIGACLVQSDFGKVTIKDLRFETASGHTMSALLLVPDSATAENPAPAIVCSHGWYNNREMQDLNYVEYARRGFVVLSIDMYGHGNSDDLASGDWWKPENNANGMYDAVKMMATLPFVDNTRIGVTGHSNGALASRTACLLDNEADTQLIAAALLVSNDAVYVDGDGNYANLFGSRDMGIVACQYDEFFHRVKQEDGSRSAPRDYINQATAQSFLHFGQDPAGQDTRAGYTYYTEDVDGQETIRVIFNAEMTHPWAHFSKNVVASSVEFFDKALGAPNMLAPNNQIWQVKAAFNALGLVGFVTFAVGLALTLLGTKPFASLAASEEAVAAPAPTGKAKRWFWISMLLGTLFSMLFYMLSYAPLSKVAGSLSGVFKQTPPLYIGIWSAACGLFTLLLIFIGNRMNGKPDYAANGVKISGAKLGKTILLAIVVAVSTYGVVFLSDWLFKTDYRLWVLTLKAFGPEKLPIILVYLPFFLLYYICNSISINSFNFFANKKGKANTALMALFNALSPLILIVFIYGFFRISGHLPSEFVPWFGGSIIGIWLYPIVVVLPVAAVVSRVLYKQTKNPYLSGIIMAILVTAMSCTNTLTVL